MSSDATIQVFAEALEAAIPEAALTISAWAETYRYLSAERSAMPGRWKNALTPHLTGIMDAVNDPTVYEIVFVKSSQIAGTSFAENVFGYYAHIDPAPILYVAETQDKAMAWSKESLAPMIRDTPVLSERIAPARERDSGNAIEAKHFPGGHLAIGYATSPATLSSRPRRIVLMDEVDGFAATKEGDPCKLAEARTRTFANRKIIKLSSPRNREPITDLPDAPHRSPIERAYDATDRRRLYVPCPHCDEYQLLVWERVRWEADPRAAYYVCANGCVIEHTDKPEMLRRCEWRADEATHQGRVGFAINELYSLFPGSTWGDMAADFVLAKKSRELLKVFVNTRLGEGWEESADLIEIDDLLGRGESYGLTAPAGVVCLTAGVDVQKNRLECEIVGWGDAEESWSLDYHILTGDPGQPEVWEQLAQVLQTEYAHESGGTVRVVAAAIDTGGHHTTAVYAFCRKHAGRNWYAIKGASDASKPLVSRPSLVGRPPTKLYLIGTHAAKDQIAAHLVVTTPGPGYCHFPDDYQQSYFEQLRAEKVVVKYLAGRATRHWEKIKPHLRNEALDCRVYALAARALRYPRGLPQVAPQVSAPTHAATPAPSRKAKSAPAFALGGGLLDGVSGFGLGSL